jgi:hypothetical protein
MMTLRGRYDDGPYGADLMMTLRGRFDDDKNTNYLK